MHFACSVRHSFKCFHLLPIDSAREQRVHVEDCLSDLTLELYDEYMYELEDDDISSPGVTVGSWKDVSVST